MHLFQPQGFGGQAGLAYEESTVLGDGLRIVLLPQFIDGKVVFRILLIPAVDSDSKSMSVEGYHAP